MILPILIKGKQPEAVAGNGLLSYAVVVNGEKKTVFYVRGNNSFRGAWWCEGGVATGWVTVTLGRGYVNGLEPVIAGKGGPKNISSPSAQLLAQWKPDGEGRMWVCVKVKVEEDTGKMKPVAQTNLQPEDLTVVVQDSPLSKDSTGLYGVVPVAMLKGDESIAEVFQLAYFDYQHSTARKPVGTGNGYRHYFHVA
jgi:hypothetical protein